MVPEVPILATVVAQAAQAQRVLEVPEAIRAQVEPVPLVTMLMDPMVQAARPEAATSLIGFKMVGMKLEPVEAV
jgi:hypothetical protein